MSSRGINSRGDRHLSHSSRHTQVPVPATISVQVIMLRSHLQIRYYFG